VPNLLKLYEKQEPVFVRFLSLDLKIAMHRMVVNNKVVAIKIPILY